MFPFFVDFEGLVNLVQDLVNIAFDVAFQATVYALSFIVRIEVPGFYV